MILDVSRLYASTEQAKLADMDRYVSAALEQAPAGEEVTLTGPGPVWLYLKLAHALHGKARTLRYQSPVTGPLVIFDHNPH